jgi:putative sigma-54 modulation protein
MEMSDALRSYTEKKLTKLDTFFEDDAEASVTFSAERGRYVTEVTVLSAGMVFRAENFAADVYASVDIVEDTIERQVRKNKTKLEKRLRSGAFEREIPATVQHEEESEEIYELVRVKRFAIKPMDVEEAILQMNMLDHEFYAFKNSGDDNRFCVVYKRHDGGYGLIESE